MKLLNEIAKERNTYADRLQQILEQSKIWLNEISGEKRLGLKPMDQMVAEADPYNSADSRTNRGTSQENDTVEFTPQPNAEKPVQPEPRPSAEPTRVHLIYDPKSGEIIKTLKTPLRSRPPADFIEANAEQVNGALKHLEKLNPELADMLVSGRMNVWIPRAAMASNPTSVKHIGLGPVTSRGNSNQMHLSPDQLAAATQAAGKMKIAR